MIFMSSEINIRQNSYLVMSVLPLTSNPAILLLWMLLLSK